ncbi:MAG TPA: AsmA family protein [Candidatus Sulfotelmatobacter sp.]|nr:AsmA family protein [Candidatus Sulfotelmatobacter sp.]
MKFFSSKRGVAAAAVILLSLFIVRPGASRLKSRIIYSISAGVGRSVDIGSVHLRLLPRPGFDLQNLVVYDDPAFGAEPMVRAGEVTAALRLTSLARGRLEIARLDLNEPSLNVVRREGRGWNLETLLQRAAHIPLAPTGKTKSEPRPAFPYIEGTGGRINFKDGQEKKAYALTNADFSLWQQSENAWGARLKAQPFRTDMNLNDTGLLQVSGAWQRAETIRDTPLEVNIEWSGAQLGQVTKLITGNDQGWRGEILLDLSLKGTPGKLQIAARSSIDDFRRYDITSGEPMRMAARCETEYSSETYEFRQLMCNAPVGDGQVTLTGDMGFPGSHHYSLVMTAEKVPAAGLVMLAQRVKKNLPDDLAAGGTLQASVTLQNAGAAGSSPQWKGRGEIADFHLSSPSNKAEIGPETVPVKVGNDAYPGEPVRNRSAAGRAGTQVATTPRVDIGSFAIAESPRSATVRGSINRTDYVFTIAGEAEIGNALRLARMAGLPAIASNAEGSAQVDLQIAGRWIVPGHGFAGPQVTGTARLRNVRIPARNSGAAAEIVLAEMQLLPDAVHIVRLNAKAAGTSWSGAIDLPRGCGTPDACPLHFVLNTNQVSLGDVNEWLNPAARKRPWYRVLDLGSDSRPAWWASLHASGRISAERVKIHGVQASHLSSYLTLEEGRVRLSGLNADVLEGKHRGEWRVDLVRPRAICSGTGTFTGVSLAAIAGAMKDGWVAGTANATYEVKGPCPADYWQTADGKLHVEVQDGVFPHVLIRDGTEPLQATLIKGEARLHNGKIQITDTLLISPEGTYRLTGTASLKQEVDLKLTRISNGAADVGYTIGGTLQDPRVVPLSGAVQATLKSLPAK